MSDLSSDLVKALDDLEKAGIGVHRYFCTQCTSPGHCKPGSNLCTRHGRPVRGLDRKGKPKKWAGDKLKKAEVTTEDDYTPSDDDSDTGNSTRAPRGAAKRKDKRTKDPVDSKLQEHTCKAFNDGSISVPLNIRFNVEGSPINALTRK